MVRKRSDKKSESPQSSGDPPRRRRRGEPAEVKIEVEIVRTPWTPERRAAMDRFMRSLADRVLGPEPEPGSTEAGDDRRS